jgi:DnaJ-class molecular chaperone
MMADDEDDTVECPVCGGNGVYDNQRCENCGGFGYLEKDQPDAE